MSMYVCICYIHTYAIQMFICLIEALCINSLVSVGVPVSVFILPLELQSYYYARRYEFDGYWIGINVFTIILSLLLAVGCCSCCGSWCCATYGNRIECFQ